MQILISILITILVFFRLLGQVTSSFSLFVVNFVDPSRSFISDKVYDKVHDKACLQLGIGIGIDLTTRGVNLSSSSQCNSLVRID